jgi:hypothetical protein
MFNQRIEIDIFNDAVIEGDIPFFSEPFGLSDIDPIGGLIGGALEAILIDEGFEKTEGVAIILGPVHADVFDIKGQNL